MLEHLALFVLHVTNPLWSNYHRHAEHRGWVSRGKQGSPPALVKQEIVRSFGEKFAVKTLVETGTFMGDMIYAVKACFDKIYTIELSESLYRDAQARFQRWSHIEVLQGDSGIVLAKVISTVDRPCLFWLDGHYSGGRTAHGEFEAPIEMELHHIAHHHLKSRHIILIDDARLFNGGSGYPTIVALQE